MTGVRVTGVRVTGVRMTGVLVTSPRVTDVTVRRPTALFSALLIRYRHFIHEKYACSFL